MASPKNCKKWRPKPSSGLSKSSTRQEAKVQVLQKKAAKAQGDAKASLNAQIGQLRKQYEDSVAKLRNVTAEKLKQAADKIRKAG